LQQQPPYIDGLLVLILGSTLVFAQVIAEDWDDDLAGNLDLVVGVAARLHNTVQWLLDASHFRIEDAKLPHGVETLADHVADTQTIFDLFCNVIGHDIYSFKIEFHHIFTLYYSHFVSAKAVTPYRNL
jgi:hypothetical protein